MSGAHAPTVYAQATAPVPQTHVSTAHESAQVSLPAPTVLIIPGISGDLAKRKLIPALYASVEKKMLDKNSVIIGIGRRDADIAQIIASGRAFIPDYKEETGKELAAIMRYVRCDIENPTDAQVLKAAVMREGGEKAGAQRIVYCALPSTAFCAVTRGLVHAGIIVPHNPHHRIVYEKPFGSDYTSAHTIADCLKKELDPQQIFLIDHYRANPLAAALPGIINANAILKNVWNGRDIRSVALVFDEALGIEDRGSFYEAYGASKDVLQNHVLQLLAGAFADMPNGTKRGLSESARFVKESHARAAFLRAVKVDAGVLGQYEGYRTEKNVAPDSRVDTFAAARLTVDTPEWRNVPFFVRTGKKLTQKRTALIVDFNAPGTRAGKASGFDSSDKHALVVRKEQTCPAIMSRHSEATAEAFSEGGAGFLCGALDASIEKEPHARVIFEYAPQKKITLYLAGLCTPIVLETTHLPLEARDAYAVLLEHILRGDHALDVGLEEIEAQWKVIEGLHALKPPLVTYKPGTRGPTSIPHAQPAHKHL